MYVGFTVHWYLDSANSIIWLRPKLGKNVFFLNNIFLSYKKSNPASIMRVRFIHKFCFWLDAYVQTTSTIIKRSGKLVQSSQKLVCFSEQLLKLFSLKWTGFSRSFVTLTTALCGNCSVLGLFLNSNQSGQIQIAQEEEKQNIMTTYKALNVTAGLFLFLV